MESTGIATGLTDLDRLMGGIRLSELVIIAARPAVGKTLFALNIVEHVAFHEGKCVALFSPDMDRSLLLRRLRDMKSEADISCHQTTIDYGELVFEDARKRPKLVIDDTIAISATDLCTDAEGLNRRGISKSL